ncbi:MAG: beta-propeller fold lactonase family protein [Anaerolineae bacterium]|nr:beta-propeller fold lactonase family protein [Anaerolineae bacterium]
MKKRFTVYRFLYATLLTALTLLLIVGAALFGNNTTLPAQAQSARATPTPLPLFALPEARSHRDYYSGSIALAPDNLTMVAANALSDSITILVPSQSRVIDEVSVGRDPRSVAITLDGTRVLVANRGDGTVSIVDIHAASVLATIPVGVWPYGVVTSSDTVAYVSLQGSGEIAEIDLIAGRVTRRFPVPDMPSGMALWGDFLYVTHFWTGEISLVYLPTGALIAREGMGGTNSISQGLALDITRGIAYLPQTLHNPDNPALTYDGAAMPVINLLELRDLQVDRRARLALDQIDRPVNMPFAVALDRFAQRLYVVNAGSDSLSVIELATGRLRAHVQVGTSPRGVLLSRDNTLLFVHNVFDGTLTTIQTSNLRVNDVLPISTVTLPTEQLIGMRLFYSARDPRMSREEWLSCATCHFDGTSDGRVWQGWPGEPLNTPHLFGLADSAPYTWTDTWDELADVEVKIRDLMGGRGLTDGSTTNLPQETQHTGLSVDLDALVTYLEALQPPDNPNRDRLDAAQVQRGEQVFAAQNCANCHAGEMFTNGQPVAVGTGNTEDKIYDTPSLRWLWLSAPYFHDGRAATLHDVFMQSGTHELLGQVPMEDIDALVAYLLSLPQ